VGRLVITEIAEIKHLEHGDLVIAHLDDGQKEKDLLLSVTTTKGRGLALASNRIEPDKIYRIKLEKPQ